MSSDLESVLDQMTKAETTIREMAEENEAAFERIFKQLDRLQSDISNLETRIDSLVTQTSNSWQINNPDPKIHWIPFEPNPYSHKLIGEHSITGPTRINCLLPASARRR